MDEIDRQIAAYRAVPLDDGDEAWGKIAALEALEPFLPDDRVLDFFLSVVADPAEYDMARVHLIKLFEIDPVPTARKRIGESVAKALPDEEEEMVRCWLGRAVAAFSDIPAARDTAISRVLDQDEDEDVRFNCLAGLSPTDAVVIPALQKLASKNNALGRAARRRLAKASDSEEADS